jgi:hypothetical protein
MHDQILLSPASDPKTSPTYVKAINGPNGINILEHWGGRRWVCFARLGVCDGQAGSDGRVGAFGHCARGREGCGGGTRLRCEWMHGPSPYCRVSYNAYLTDCKVKVVAFKFFFGEGGCVRDWLFVAKKQRIKEAKGVRILN